MLRTETDRGEDHMNIEIGVLLRDKLFENKRILAGSSGLVRNVKRVSVFDCPCVPDILQRKTLCEGDLFLTCLEQFRDDGDGSQIHFYLNCLIQSGSAGLLVITDDRLALLTPELLRLCDENQFPVVLVPEDYPYAVILDTVNNYITFDTYNTINKLRLDKIMYEDLSESARSDVLYSIKSTVKSYVQAIFIHGSFNSDIARLELQNYYLNRENDIFVRTDQGMIILLSEEKESKTNASLEACLVRIKEFLDNPVVGYSRVFPRKDCGKALEEARRALETARAMRMTVRTYDALSTIQLLTVIKDTQEAEDYYEAYLSALRTKIAEENLPEMIATIENYVANSGDFSLTAEMMNQHVNTIRYRINRAKSALNMEHDTIKFNETIAIAVKLRVLLNRKI